MRKKYHSRRLYRHGPFGIFERGNVKPVLEADSAEDARWACEQLNKSAS